MRDVRVIAAAVAGGAAGYALFFWLVGRGYYGLAIPGGMVGAGGAVFRSRSWGTPIACGVLAVLVGFFTEWRYSPFVADAGFGYLISHVAQLGVPTLAMIAVGGFAGFWFTYRRLER